MENNFYYYKWFQKVMSVVLDIFFVAAPLASLYVFTSFLTGGLRIAAFVAIIAVYCLVIYFFKDKVKNVLNSLLSYISRLDVKTMVLIIVLAAIFMKILFTVLFSFDSTNDGDVKIYSDIADQIIATGNLHTYAISHLYGVALHFVLFKLAGIPLHVGMFLIIFIGTLVNFFSFVRVVGKDKGFLIVMIYLLMPSTALLSFCMTHEIFAYMYVSIFLYFFSHFIEERNTYKMILDLLMMILNTVLMCFVNPGGYIIYIIIVLTIVLSNLKPSKKAMIFAVLVISALCSRWLTTFLQVYEYRTTMNTFTILIHGSNPWSLGEQVDGYPLDQMRKYIFENTLDFTHDGFVDAAQHVLLSQYKYLLTHPLTLIRLVIHKTYILWSGMHYPIELGNHYGSINGFVYYALLAFNTLVYLFVLTVGLVFYRTKDDGMLISNYKLEFLGVYALTMFCIVANKYSLYVTLFLYLIAFYRAEIGTDEHR